MFWASPLNCLSTPQAEWGGGLVRGWGWNQHIFADSVCKNGEHFTLPDKYRMRFLDVGRCVLAASPSVDLGWGGGLARKVGWR